jgi:hypothetical protein
MAKHSKTQPVYWCGNKLDRGLGLIATQTGALTPINQNVIKQGECCNLERDQTERDKSELDKAHISADPDFAQTDFAQTELAKNHVLQI